MASLELPEKHAIVVAPPKPLDIDDMTVREARELYGKLHKMFGGEL